MSFRKNIDHFQRSLFGVYNQISDTRLKMLENSKEAKFYEIIFKNIDESQFAVLYDEANGRPNSAVNVLTSSKYCSIITDGLAKNYSTI